MVRIKENKNEEGDLLTTDVEQLKDRYTDVEKNKTSTNPRKFRNLWARLISTVCSDGVFFPLFSMTAVARLIYFTGPALVLAYLFGYVEKVQPASNSEAFVA